MNQNKNIEIKVFSRLKLYAHDACFKSLEPFEKQLIK